MTNTTETIPAGIEPEGGWKRPFTEDDPDTEGHMPIKRNSLTEPGPDEPDSADTEAHMPLRRGATDDKGTEPDAAKVDKVGLTKDDTDTEGHMPLRRVLPATEDTELEPESVIAAKEFVNDDDDADTEGHMPLKRVLHEPAPDEPGADDTEAHMPVKRGATEDKSYEPDDLARGRGGLTEDDDADTEGHMPLKRGVTEPGTDDLDAEDAEGHMPLRKVLPATEDVPEPEEMVRSGRAIDDEDTEGHMPFKRGVTEPGPGKAATDDTEAHMPYKRGIVEGEGIEPEGAKVNHVGLAEDDEDASTIEPVGLASSKH